MNHETLRFGKYKGCRLEEIPEDYLLWMVESNRRLVTLIDEELARRAAREEADLPWVERLIKKGYRELVKQYHPDTVGAGPGSDNQEIRAINAAYEWLREAAKMMEERT